MRCADLRPPSASSASSWASNCTHYAWNVIPRMMGHLGWVRAASVATCRWYSEFRQSDRDISGYRLPRNIFLCDKLLTNDEIHKEKSKRRKVTEISCRNLSREIFCLFFWLVAGQKTLVPRCLTRRMRYLSPRRSVLESRPRSRRPWPRPRVCGTTQAILP